MSTKYDTSSFIKSDYCSECGGKGYYVEKTWTCPSTGEPRIDLEQCWECEEWHDREVRADRQHDIDKGN